MHRTLLTFREFGTEPKTWALKPAPFHPTPRVEFTPPASLPAGPSLLCCLHPWEGGQMAEAGAVRGQGSASVHLNGGKVAA